MTAALAILLLASPSPSVKAVSGELVCRAQHAIRHRNPAWTADTCARVAEAVNATFDPYLVLAVGVNESDLREFALRKARRGVYDTGLLGIRCRLAPGTDFSTRAFRARSVDNPPLASRCMNWPVRGRRLEELLDPVVSIQAGEQLLKRKRQRDPRHWLRHYNGGTVEHGYAARVSATKAALHGRRRLVESATVNKRTWQIVKAVLE
jgi:hypothetical protein